MESKKKDLAKDIDLVDAIMNDEDLKGLKSVLVVDLIKQIKSGAIDIKTLEDIVFKTDPDLKVLASIVKPEMLSDKDFLETIMLKSETIDVFVHFAFDYLKVANVYDIMGLLKKMYDLYDLNLSLSFTKYVTIAITCSLNSNITFLDKLLIRIYASNLLGSKYPSFKQGMLDSFNSLLEIQPQSNENDCEVIYQKYVSESKNPDVPENLKNMVLTAALDVTNAVKDTKLSKVVTGELRSLTFRDIEKDMSLINKVRLLIQYHQDINSNLSRSIN